MRYHLSGERLESDVPLDGLLGPPRPSEPEPATISVERVDRLGEGSFDAGEVLQRVDVGAERWLTVAALGQHYVMRAHGCADFALDPREPGRVRVALALGLDHPQLPFFVVNRVVPFVLALRGRSPLHASAVVRQGFGAVAFVGDPGSGKSTLAAALCPPMLLSSDDCVVFEVGDGSVMVEPSHSMARLCADSLCRLDEGAAPTMAAKSLLPRPASLSRQPLRMIYSLCPGATGHAVEPMSVRDGVVELARHLFRVDPTDKLALAGELSRLEQVVRAVPVARLRFSHDLDALDALCRFVADDIAS